MPKTTTGYNEATLKGDIMKAVVQSKVWKENQTKLQVNVLEGENSLLVEIKTSDPATAGQLIGKHGKNIKSIPLEEVSIREVAEILSLVGKRVSVSTIFPEKPKA